jgi:pyruvate/2-oxoglutarate dehydrogenase complex dihydrolipoamide acyltransferase (E2) component
MGVLVAGFICTTVLVTALLDSGHLAIGESGSTEDKQSRPAQPPLATVAQPPAATAASKPAIEAEEPTIPHATGQAAAAGDPIQVAREFALGWINRPNEPGLLRQQDRRLIALSTGPWADQIGVMLTASTGSGSRGTVVRVDVLRRGVRRITALVTTREQLAPRGQAVEPYHYALYLTHLQRVGHRGFALSSWEPQI